MSRNYLMQWDEKNRRWYKRTPQEFIDVAGKKITKVSCKQLNAPPTKAASYKSANGWWRNQIEEWRSLKTVSNQNQFPQAEEDAETLEAMSVWLKEHQDQEAAERKSALARRIRQDIQGGIEPNYTDREIYSISDWDNMNDVDFYAQYISDVNVWHDRLNTGKPASKNKSIQVWIDTFLEVLKPKTKPQSLQNIKRQLEEFPAWHGAAASIESIDESIVRAFYLHLRQNELADSTNRDIFSTWRRWVNFLADENQIERPRNLLSREFTFQVTHAAQAPEQHEIITFLGKITDDRIRLYALLCLNCGMNNADIGQLYNTNHSWKRSQSLLQERKITNGHVDWEEGRLVRQRQKTKGKGKVPTVCYKLWPETLRLLQEYRSDNDRYCLLSPHGAPLWERGEKRIDEVYGKTWKQMKSISPKQLRSGAATILGQHDSYKLYISHFLADSPRGIPDRHYVVPSQKQFDAAIAWLRKSLKICQPPKDVSEAAPSP